MADNTESDNYFKCSKCKCKYEKDKFGLNRFNNMYKTCITCRNKYKKKSSNNATDSSNNNETNSSDNYLSHDHYDVVDKELRAKFEKEFGIDSRSTEYKFFTEDQQVERYAKMLVFWDTNKPCINSLDDIMVNNSLDCAKYFYISDKRSQVNKQIFEKFNKRVQKLIGDKYRQLIEIYNENKLVENFTKRNEYPSYPEVLKIISDDIPASAAYGELNHEWMKKVWENVNDEKR